MFQKRYYYLVRFQFLGYRFHGWQKQPNTKTLHLMIDRTLKYVLKDQYFKTLAASRTDAKVSAEEAAFELFLKDKPLDDLELFMAEFNANLPQDIRALSIDEVTSDFNIIQDSKYKEYHYIFSQGEKCHPFCAPIMTTILEPLNISMMIKGAALLKANTILNPTATRPLIKDYMNVNCFAVNFWKISCIQQIFFPKRVILRVIGKGFGRHQIRLMMGALIKLGRGEVDLDFIAKSLTKEFEGNIDYIAPASGLILHKIDF